jgi:hypothetical protein
LDLPTEQQLAKSCEEAFEQLVKACITLNPYKLLTQLTMTYLMAPENEVIYPDNPIAKKQIYIEFITALICNHLDFQNIPNESVDGENLNQVMEACDKYFQAMCDFLSLTPPQGEPQKYSLLLKAKIYSLFVRGESYPDKMIELASSLYGGHCGDIFRESFGFEFKDVVDFYHGIILFHNETFNLYAQAAKEISECAVEVYYKNNPGETTNKEELKGGLFCAKFFGNSSEIMCFNIDQINKFTKLDRNICEKILNRLSQTLHPWLFKGCKVFQNPITAPWDFNKLYERPILENNNKYFLPAPQMLSNSLFHTFYYDLITNSQLKNKFTQAFGVAIEDFLYNQLCKIFPKNKVYKNLGYKFNNQEGEIDVLVHYDQIILIIQLKAKRLTLDSKTGNSIKMLEDDLAKGIRDPFSQNKQAFEYLRGDLKEFEFYNLQSKETILKLDNQKRNVFMINTTLGDLQGLGIQVEILNSVFQFWNNQHKCFTVSLLDFSVIMEILEKPYDLIHYIHRRLEVEKFTTSIETVDEIELLGFYLKRNLHGFDECFNQNITGIFMSNFSDPIDEYYFHKYDGSEEAKLLPKPKQASPKHSEIFSRELLKALSHSPYKSKVILLFKDFSYEAQQQIIEGATVTISKVRSGEPLSNLRCSFKDFEFCFLAINSKKVDYESHKIEYINLLRTKVCQVVILLVKDMSKFSSQYIDEVTYITC